MSTGQNRPSAEDIVMLSGTGMQVGALLRLDGPAPTPERLRKYVAERLDGIPTLCHTISGKGARARWVRVPVDVGRHVRHVTLPNGQGVREWATAHRLAPFPAGGPAWDLTLVTDGTATSTGHQPFRPFHLFYRVSHGLQDGGGLVRTLEKLFRSEPVPEDASSAVVPEPHGAPRPTARERYEAWGALTCPAKSGLWPMSATPAGAERWEWVSVPTGLLRAAGQAHGGTSNDASLAALARVTLRLAARRRPEWRGRRLPLYMPVNLRRSGAADACGNHVVLLALPLPGTLLPPAEFVRATARATGRVKGAGHRAAFTSVLRRTPRWATRAALWWMWRASNAAPTCSYVVFRHPLDLDGSPVVAVEPVTRHTRGFPVSVLLMSYLGRASVVFVTDPALPGMERLHLDWREELHALAGSSCSSGLVQPGSPCAPMRRGCSG